MLRTARTCASANWLVTAGGRHAVYGLGLIRPWSWAAWRRDMPAFRDVCDRLLGLLPSERRSLPRSKRNIFPVEITRSEFGYRFRVFLFAILLLRLTVIFMRVCVEMPSLCNPERVHQTRHFRRGVLRQKPQCSLCEAESCLAGLGRSEERAKA